VPTGLRHLDPAPARPEAPLPSPSHRVAVTVDVDVAHLANPLLAVQRLLASEAGGFAQVHGDEARFVVTVVVPDLAAETVAAAESWIRWCVHNAGVRGRCTRRSSA
jgi:hypothetical protein